MLSAIVLIFPALVAGFPDGNGHHHGDGHDNNCVDISRYSEIKYNISVADICTYRTARVCSKKVNNACVSIPEQQCKVVGYAKCESGDFTKSVHDDGVDSLPFQGKECYQSGTQTLNEKHKKPECKNVTREQCDSKWVLNTAGEKVWAGNENCVEKTWEECTLVDTFEDHEVPIWTCKDSKTIFYNVPVLNEISITGYNTGCRTAAYAECTTTSRQECAQVEYEECADIIEPFCLGNLEFRIPYQSYDHRLKCIV